MTSLLPGELVSNAAKCIDGFRPEMPASLPIQISTMVVSTAFFFPFFTGVVSK
jgi:hypothetical protein